MTTFLNVLRYIAIFYAGAVAGIVALACVGWCVLKVLKEGFLGRAG